MNDIGFTVIGNLAAIIAKVAAGHAHEDILADLEAARDSLKEALDNLPAELAKNDAAADAELAKKP